MTLLDYPNVIGLNGSNSDGEMSHFMGAVTRKICYAILRTLLSRCQLMGHGTVCKELLLGACLYAYPYLQWAGLNYKAHGA